VANYIVEGKAICLVAAEEGFDDSEPRELTARRKPVSSLLFPWESSGLRDKQN